MTLSLVLKLAFLACFASYGAALPSGSATGVSLERRTNPTCPGGKAPTKTSVDANADDLGTQLLFAPLPTPYKLLDYQGFAVQSYTQTLNMAALVPHSPPNTIVKGVGTSGGPGLITTNYPNSNVTSFDLKSLFFGCAIGTGQGNILVPQSCDVTITGYRGADNTVADAQFVAARTFVFSPTSITLAQQQAPANLGTALSDIQFATVTFTIRNSAPGLEVDLLLSLDNIKSDVYKC